MALELLRVADSWGEAVALGFQHYILCLGTAVMIPTLLVPLMSGNARLIISLQNTSSLLLEELVQLLI